MAKYGCNSFAGKRLNSNSSVQWSYHLMVLPCVIMVFLFNTRTWPGILAAFEDFIPAKGWWDSKWIGLKNFRIFFSQPDAWNIVRNTLVIAVGKIVVGQISALAVALMLNEIRTKNLKKGIQTATYLPHFISWVVYATILKGLIGTNGLINQLLFNSGHSKIMFLGKAEIFPLILISTETLKEVGYRAIIYLAAITAVNPMLYDASSLDGANRWQQTLHVTIPGIRHIIVLNCVLSLGDILTAGFDQIFNLYNILVYPTGDVIDTWVYRMGLVSMNYGVATSVSLLRSVIALILTIIAYWAADKFADYKIF